MYKTTLPTEYILDHYLQFIYIINLYEYTMNQSINQFLSVIMSHFTKASFNSLVWTGFRSTSCIPAEIHLSLFSGNTSAVNPRMIGWWVDSARILQLEEEEEEEERIRL